MQAEERIIQQKMNKEYAAITGIPEFCEKAIELALGNDSLVLSEKRNATSQGISGTGSLAIGATFLKKFWKGNPVVYLPNPTWGNHIPIFMQAGLETKLYRYYDPKTSGLDFVGLLDDISVSKIVVSL